MDFSHWLTLAQRWGRCQDLTHAGHKWLCFPFSGDFPRSSSRLGLVRGYYFPTMSGSIYSFFLQTSYFFIFLTWPTFNCHQKTEITCCFKSLNNTKCLYPSGSLLTTNQIRKNYITFLYSPQLTLSDFWVCQEVEVRRVGKEFKLSIKYNLVNSSMKHSLIVSSHSCV